jgi:hypothetical protein
MVSGPTGVVHTIVDRTISQETVYVGSRLAFLHVGVNVIVLVKRPVRAFKEHKISSAAAQQGSPDVIKRHRQIFNLFSRHLR